jgi:hypothetical protein
MVKRLNRPDPLAACTPLARAEILRVIPRMPSTVTKDDLASAVSLVDQTDSRALRNALDKVKYAAVRDRSRLTGYAEEPDDEDASTGQRWSARPSRAFVGYSGVFTENKAGDVTFHAGGLTERDKARSAEIQEYVASRQRAESRNPRPDSLGRALYREIKGLRWTAIRQCSGDAELIREAAASRARIAQLQAAPVPDVPMSGRSEVRTGKRQQDQRYPDLWWDWWDFMKCRGAEPLRWYRWPALDGSLRYEVGQQPHGHVAQYHSRHGRADHAGHARLNGFNTTSR